MGSKPSSVVLRLAPQFAPLLSANGDACKFDEGTWGSVAEQLRERHPSLAGRVLVASGGIADGIALVVNDEVVSRPPDDLRLRGGDVITLIGVLAGG